MCFLSFSCLCTVSYFNAFAPDYCLFRWPCLTCVSPLFFFCVPYLFLFLNLFWVRLVSDCFPVYFPPFLPLSLSLFPWPLLSICVFLCDLWRCALNNIIPCLIVCRRVPKWDVPYSYGHLPVCPGDYAPDLRVFVCLFEDYTYLPCPARTALRNRLD